MQTDDMFHLEIRLARQCCIESSLTDLAHVLFGEDAAAIVASTGGLRPLLEGHGARDLALDNRVRISAFAELVRRLSQERITGGVITNPTDVAKRFMHLVPLDHEQLHVVALDVKHRILRSRCLAVGTTASVTVEMAEVLRFLIDARAAAFVLVHNHPGGSAGPSDSDRALTDECFAIARRVGLQPLDHVIVAAGNAYSFAQRELFATR